MTNSASPPDTNPARVPGPMRLAVGLFALATILCSSLMLLLLRPYPYAHNFPDEVNSPVLALELPKDANALKSVLQDEDASKADDARHVFRINNMLDFIFIPLYGGFLGLFVNMFRSVPGTRLIRRLVICSILFAAVFDYVEDFGITKALRNAQITDNMARSISLPSHVKWFSLGISLILIGTLLFRSDGFVYSRATLRIQAVLFVAAGLFILFGLRMHSKIELGMNCFGVCILWNAGALLGPVLAQRFPGTHHHYTTDFCEQARHAADASVAPAKAIHRHQ
jgi:hypothetical protein